MDVPQLKLLAGLVRGLLEQHNVPIGHSQSLDLIAALPGLRNWPEVNAFPDRVAVCELNGSTIARLAHRLRSRHNVELTAQELVSALSPPGTARGAGAAPPQIWPTGPASGVYVTTSQEAINALLHQYEEATDGELVYAESAASDWEGAIDLGEWGLSSKGLARVPSGTLIVVGPVQLNQQSWEDSANKLDWACLRADLDGHRVAVLIDTPQPELMFKDIELAIRSVTPYVGECYPALTGIVTEEGELRRRTPFVQPVVPRIVSTANAPTDALPRQLLDLLQQRLKERSTGVLVLSSCVWEEHWGVEQIAAALPLTEAVGPACRIKPRSRGTPAKDMMVPDVVRELPFLSSVESAYAHGYRRMLVTSSYTDFSDLLKYDDVLFFVGGHNLEVEEAVVETVRLRGSDELDRFFERLVACAGVAPVAVGGETVHICDAFIPDANVPFKGRGFSGVVDHVRKHRTIRWEEELDRLLEDGAVTPEQVRASIEPRRGQTLDAALAKWGKRRGRTTA
ncbi:hypothetical protein [Roseateles sp. P5_E11]